MLQEAPITLLCLASYFKGGRFIEACKRLGCHTILATREKVADEAWPREDIDEFFKIPDLSKQPDITHAISYLARDRRLARIVALDEFDTETAAALREHLRIPGMGETTARYFRDKLAMRMKAAEAEIRVPPFVHVLNHARVHTYTQQVPPPWVLKPRAEASAMGIKMVQNAEELWDWIASLGDRQSFFLLEKFLPGDVYHVDVIVWDKEVVFAAASKYWQPPMEVYQGGGVFITRTLPYGSEEQQELEAQTRQLVAAFGLVRGVAHVEFIKSREDGQFYFLESAARVGGAGIDQLVEEATDINLWAEWARLEVYAARGKPYRVPPARKDAAGLIVCLARQEYPDLTAYEAPEVVWRLLKKHHAGLIVASHDTARVEELLMSYSRRFAEDFLASAAPLEGHAGAG